MRIRDLFTTATKGLVHAKMRSSLTMLGIVIGVASVILLMSIGDSARKLIISQVQQFGSNVISVTPGAIKSRRFSGPASLVGLVTKTLKKEDVEALRREPSILYASGEVHGQAKIVYGNNDTTVLYSGSGADMFKIVNFELAKGSYYTRLDEDSISRVVILGSEVAKTLFGEIDPVGKNVRIKDISFRVVGVFASKGTGGIGGNIDSSVMIPVTTAQKLLLGIDYYNASVVMKADENYTTEYVRSRVRTIMRQSHNITDPSKDDFTIYSMEDALTLLGNITSILTVFLTAIASIALVVGGIGVMNIMLVSVVERTGEIGLRKAVGASEGDILGQFLIESVVLTFLGGIIGIIIGASFAAGIWLIVSRYFLSAWEVSLPLNSVLLAVTVSTLTGLVFGIYPARQASRKNPIDALRYE